MHFWLSRSKSPCPEQSGKHWRASWSTVAQVGPRHPWRQTQDPSTQKPCPEQLGSGQSPILVKLESQVFKEFINKNGNELQLK